MEIETFAAHYEKQTTVDAPAELVFEYLDDFERLGAHMTRSSWMMAGSKMSYEFDNGKGRRLDSHVRLIGSFLGLKLEIDERVIDRAPAQSKAWQTTGTPRMLILAQYRMGFSLWSLPHGCRVTAFIDYSLPARGFGRVLGRVAGGAYARWCVRNVLDQAAAQFGIAADVGISPPASKAPCAAARRHTRTLRLLFISTAAWLIVASFSRHVHAAEDQAQIIAPALTLEIVVENALRNRGEIVAAQARASALAQRPAIVGALEDPMISPAIDHYPFDMMDEEGGSRYDWSVSIEQRIPLSGVRGHRRRAAEADALRAGAEAERTALDVVSQAQRAFFMLRERREMSIVLASQLALARQVVDSAAARYSSGTGSQADVLRAEVETARVEAAQRSIASQIRAAQSMLNVAMGLPATTPIGDLSYSPSLSTIPSRASAEGTALFTRPELRVGEAEIERAIAEIDVMKSMYRPMAVIRAGRASTMAEGPGAMLMIGVTVPIWRGRLRAGEAEARSMERMARADLEAMKLMVAGEAAAAREEVEAARETVRSLEIEIIPRAVMAVDAVLAAYSSGQGSLISVVDAFGALWRARGDLVMANSQLGDASVSLERALGRSASTAGTR